MLTIQRTLTHASQPPDVQRPRDIWFMAALRLATGAHAELYLSHQRESTRLVIQLAETPQGYREVVTYNGTSGDIATLARALEIAVRQKA